MEAMMQNGSLLSNAGNPKLLPRKLAVDDQSWTVPYKRLLS